MRFKNGTQSQVTCWVNDGKTLVKAQPGEVVEVESKDASIAALVGLVETTEELTATKKAADSEAAKKAEQEAAEEAAKKAADEEKKKAGGDKK